MYILSLFFIHLTQFYLKHTARTKHLIATRKEELHVICEKDLGPVGGAYHPSGKDEASCCVVPRHTPLLKAGSLLGICTDRVPLMLI